MLIAFLIIAGLGLLFIGGEVLIRGAVALARNLGLPPMLIGLTVVAYGTSSPELVVSVQAGLTGLPGISMGNIIGSNISNILLVLGISSLILPLKADKRLIQLDAIFMLSVVILLYFLCLSGTLSIVHGFILVGCLIGYSYITFRSAMRERSNLPLKQTEEIEEQIKLKLDTPKAIGTCVLGLIILILGADVLIRGAVDGARAFGISESTIGLTLIAFGSSAPELATAIIAAYRKHPDIAIGNVIGSNIFNIVGILGITPILHPLPIEGRFLFFDIPVLLAVTAALLLVLKHKQTISRLTGCIFTMGYVAYIAAQFWFQ